MSEPRRLKYVVWETTRRCDQVCLHCVNASGRPAPGELSADEARDLVRQILALGTVTEVGLTGGESYLRREIYELIATLRQAGLIVRMQTGGFTLTEGKARKLKEAGLSSLGVSIDGLEATHDLQRGRAGSFAAALTAIDRGRAAGLPIGVNTQINRLSRAELPELCQVLRAHQVAAWRLGLTLPAGRGDAHPDWILQPWEILEVMPTLAALQQDAWDHPLPHESPHPFDISGGSNLGYFGPHEITLRSFWGAPRHWEGPQDGLGGVFVSCDGDVRGSTFLPGGRYLMGNLRRASLKDIWEDEDAAAYTRRRSVDDLGGFCRGCYYADVCYGGDILSAEMLLGRRGEYPHCFHRAHGLKRQGLRERLIPREQAPGVGEGAGRFVLVQEPWPAE